MARHATVKAICMLTISPRMVWSRRVAEPVRALALRLSMRFEPAARRAGSKCAKRTSQGWASVHEEWLRRPSCE